MRFYASAKSKDGREHLNEPRSLAEVGLAAKAFNDGGYEDVCVCIDGGIGEPSKIPYDEIKSLIEAS